MAVIEGRGPYDKQTAPFDLAVLIWLRYRKINSELSKVHFFIATLGFSGYPYCEAYADEKMNSWITGHIHALEYFGGTPRILIPDNCKIATHRPNHYDPEINKTWTVGVNIYRSERIGLSNLKNLVNPGIAAITIGLTIHNNIPVYFIKNPRF
ncbi:MAG: hypothetical protein SCM11_06360 [Bacillota bacterium]|nr:hypothetical protein [Bacillota bacterium]